MGPTWSIGPKWAKCWPHKPCYQGHNHDDDNGHCGDDHASHCSDKQRSPTGRYRFKYYYIHKQLTVYSSWMGLYDK